MSVGGLALLILLFLLVNHSYKGTNHYHNMFIDVQPYDKGVPNALQLVNLGSTYAQHAFGTYEELQIKGFSFAMPSQSLQVDQNILKAYKERLAKGCVVVIVVAACLFLFNEEPDKMCKFRYQKAFPKVQKYPLKFATKIKAAFPILFHPKQIRYILRDDLKLADFYAKYPTYMDVKCSEREMDSLVECWKSLFRLADMKQLNFSEINKQTVRLNETILKEIIDFCKENGFRPILVVPPFSKCLNQHFSSEFKNVVVHEKLLAISNEMQIPYLNYQDDADYQYHYELFCDGGFRLNKRGSKYFICRLARDLQKFGINISNKTVGRLE